MQGDYAKITIFNQYLALSRKWYNIWPLLLRNANRKKRTKIFEWYHRTIFNGLERSIIDISRIRYYLTLNISETVRDTDIYSYRYNKILIGTYTRPILIITMMSPRMTSSDLE